MSTARIDTILWTQKYRRNYMPEIDLSPAVPSEARWVKLSYEISPIKPGAQLIARVWTGTDPNRGLRLEGPSGEVTMPLASSCRLNYQFPVTVRFKLKVVAYSTAAP